MNYIDIKNPYAIYYLWLSEFGKKYITNLLNSILKEDNQYSLLDTFNSSTRNVRSYLFFESEKLIVFVDFNIYEDNYILQEDLNLIKFLQKIQTKEVYLIIFNNYNGKNNHLNNIYNIYYGSNNKNLSYLYAKSISEQKLINFELTKYLYQMPINFYYGYIHEYILQKINKSMIQ
jgi:hypothetical protein